MLHFVRGSSRLSASAPLLRRFIPCGITNVTTQPCRTFSSEDTQAPAMYYRMLGNTGMQVSVLSFGFWATFGAKPDIKGDAGLEKAKDCLRIARKAGVNFFDNAEVYGAPPNPKGEAELIMGEAIRQLREEDAELWRRSDLLISTKIFWGGSGANEVGLSRKHIREGTDAACERLQVDYVDMIYCHRPDPFTPTETIVRAMSDIVRSGKAMSWGTSEWSAQQITEAFFLSKLHGLEPPEFEQPEYNMFHRDRVESEYYPLYNAPYNYGTTIWSPLAGGFLTGKYNDSVPTDSRANTDGYKFLLPRLEEWHADGKIDKIRRLSAYAEERYQCTTAQLAIAWCLKNQNVSTVLLGATKPEQLDETLASVRVARDMTDEDFDHINSILDNSPTNYEGWGADTGSYRTFNALNN